MSSGEVLDASGDPVDEVMQRWLLFIALHLESDNEFSDDDLVDDVLRALGFQDEDERKRRSKEGSPDRELLGERLEELKETTLIERIDNTETGRYRYQAVVELERIDQAVVSLGGSIWHGGDADRFDTEAELAWLLIIALRMCSDRVAHDELIKRFSSLLGKDGAYSKPISDIIIDLRRRGLIQLEEGRFTSIVRRVSGGRVKVDGYKITDDEHVGLGELWEQLHRRFGDKPLSIETPMPVTGEPVAVPDDDQVVVPSTSPQPPASLETAEVPSQAESVEPNEIGEQQETSPQRRSAPVALQQQVPGDGDPDEPKGLSRDSHLQPLGDADLCLAILQTLEKAFDGPAPSFEDIKKELLNGAAILVEYDEVPPPPWVERINKSGDPSTKRFNSLLEFRLDHALRAMSLHRTGLIRSAEIASEGHHWNLTRAGYEILRNIDNDGKQQLARQTKDYFSIHNYSSWRTTRWITEFMDHLAALGKDGMVFEQLCLELLSKVHPDSKVEQSAPNGWLDSNAVDHLVTTIQDLDDEQQAMNRPDSKLLLVQCKRWEAKEVDAGQIAKLFASAARFRAQAYNNRELSDIEGARFIYLGSLSHDATWIYWALRDAWEKLDEPASTSGQIENSQPSLRWELWDGAKLFSLIKDYELGVRVNRSSNIVAIDDTFFDQLEEKVQLRKMFKN